VQRRHRLGVIAVVAILAIGAGALVSYGRGVWFPLLLQIRGERSVADVLARFGPAARSRLAPHFQRAGLAYPPKRIALLVFKRERRVALWARDDGAWRFIRDYPILAASGHAGPKLREGDYQVPEGVYRLEYLNPNSSYHLSMKVNYPNQFDRRRARSDGRTRLGGDIFIHGKNVSIGCVAVGDRAIEELFTLVGTIGVARTQVIIAPNDLRTGRTTMHEEAPAWVSELYRTIRTALRPCPLAGGSGSALDVVGRFKTKIEK
jgi:hypothetical protein